MIMKWYDKATVEINKEKASIDEAVKRRNNDRMRADE